MVTELRLRPPMNQQLITIKFATSKLEMLANRLWKSGEPHDLDYVYGRIWLHSLELAHYFGSATAEEYLRGLVGHCVAFCRAIYNYNNTFHLAESQVSAKARTFGSSQSVRRHL